MQQEKKDYIIMTVIIGIVCIVLFSVMFMQFKTIEETDITSIENMRETELRAAISEWKTKYEETAKKLETNQKSIKEYQEKIEKNEKATNLIDKDLKESEMLLGKTNVYGEGVVITITDNSEYKVSYSDLLDLVNELKYAGAEAISINDVRIINMTEISQPNSILMRDDVRISSPYVIKAIGNQTYLSSTLSLKDTGFIDKYTAVGMNVKLETSKNVQILKYNGEMDTNYMMEGEAE